METDWHNPLMLTTCYEATGDTEALRRVAKLTFERAERAVTSDPTNGTALAGGAYSLAAFGERERARDWTRRALLLDPDNLNMRFNLACTLIRQLGDADEAIETLRPFFDRLQQHDPASATWGSIQISHPLREDPRFKEMFGAAKKRLGMTEAEADA